MNPAKALYDAAKQDLSHVIVCEGKVVCALGVQEGLFWVMFTNEIKKKWIGLVRQSHRFIAFYHNFYDHLHSDVWSENEFVHQWLMFLGFEPFLTVDTPDNHKVIRFVRCNCAKNNVGFGLSRPAMH